VLGAWATAVGALEAARVAAPYQVGWCSWYHYFHDVTESAVRDNLARASDWPFDVFQIDDGYQAHIGDWLNTAASFPSGLAAIADAIAAEGCRPGLWLAPFLAHPDARSRRGASGSRPTRAASRSPGCSTRTGAACNGSSTPPAPTCSTISPTRPRALRHAGFSY